MIRVFLPLLVVVLAIVGCSKIQVTEIYYDEAKTHLKERFETLKDKPGVKNGKYESFFMDGKPESIKFYTGNLLSDSILVYDAISHQLKEKAFYQKGALQGKRYLYFDSNKVMICENYFNDQLHGSYTSYFKNGKIEQQGQYVKGQLSGLWNYYYENGILKEKVNYAEGHEFGAYESFYPNGSKKSLGFYLDENVEDSTWQLFYESGELMEISHYKNGLEEGLTQAYSKDHKLSKEIEYKNGIPVVYKDFIHNKFTTHPQYLHSK